MVITDHSNTYTDTGYYIPTGGNIYFGWGTFESIRPKYRKPYLRFTSSRVMPYKTRKPRKVKTLLQRNPIIK